MRDGAPSQSEASQARRESKPSLDDPDKLKIMLPRRNEPLSVDPHAREEHAQPRKFMIYKRDLGKFGYTPQHPEIDAEKHSKANTYHNQQCREFITKNELLEDDETPQRSHSHQLREDMWIATQNKENEEVKVDGASAEEAKTLKTMRIWSTGLMMLLP